MVLTEAATAAVTTELLHGVGQSIERSRIVNKSFNYERVFWNTAFSLGIIGLGWIAVKTGQTVKALSDPVATAEKIVNGMKDKGLETVYSYVEGENKNKSLVGVPPGLGAPISFYRNNPDEWKKFKEAREKNESVAGTAEEPPDILDRLDEIYTDWGEYLPVGAVLLHFGMEARRVQLARAEDREIKETSKP